MTTSNSLAGTISISAMELRSNPGTILDRVDYKKESFIVERAGKAKAVLIPMSEYEEVQRIKKDAKSKLLSMAKKIQKQTSKYDPKKIQAAIDEAVENI